MGKKHRKRQKLASSDREMVAVLGDLRSNLAEAERKTVLEGLAEDRTAETLYELTENAWWFASEGVGLSPGRRDFQCAAGCYFCCYTPVQITTPEALTLAEELRRSRSPDEFSTLRERVAGHEQKIRPLSLDGHLLARIPCALLVDGRCSVYEARPIACRGLNSPSRAGCEASFRGAVNTIIVDAHAFVAASGVAEGFTQGTSQTGLVSGHYELHSALLRALDDPDATDRWLRGENVLEGCKTLEPG
jgi:hypothetical protein